MSRLPKDLACQHLKSTGHKAPSRVANFLAKLQNENGLKFTLDYISNVADAVRNTLITGKYTIPPGIKINRYLLKDGTRVKVPAAKWIRSALSSAKYIHDNHLPLDSNTAKKVHAVINLKHVYKFNKAQPHHIEKFNSSIMEKTFKSWSGIDGINPMELHSGREIILKAAQSEVRHESLYSYFVTEKKSPVFNYNPDPKDQRFIISVESKDPRSRDLTPLILLYDRCSLKGKQFIERVFHDIVHYKGNTDFGYLLGRAQRAIAKKNFNKSATLKDTDLRLLVGKISHLMESAGKDRAIAQPFLVFQIFFEPLKEILTKMQKADPFVFTHDQQAGVKLLQDSLNRGNKLFCYDASSWTDKFPLEYQLFVLRKYRLYEWAEVVETFAKGTYYDPAQKQVVFYIQGQAPGVGHSFGMATISNSELIFDIYLEIYKKDVWKVLEERPYAVVGDDVGISDAQVAAVYDDIMRHWGVVINMAKSVISCEYGEFCGVLFNKTSRVPAYKPKEWRLDHHSLASSYNYYGKNWLKNLGLLQKKGPKDKHGKLKASFVLESMADQEIFLYTIASKGGGLKKMGIYTFLNIIKKDINSIASWIESNSDYTAPHYEFLRKFVKEALNLNYARGYHSRRFRIRGNVLFHRTAPISSVHHPEKGGYFFNKLKELQKVNWLQNLDGDADTLLQLSEIIGDEKDFADFTEMFHEFNTKLLEIYKWVRSAHETDPDTDTSSSIETMLKEVYEVKELLKADPNHVKVHVQPVIPHKDIPGEEVVVPTKHNVTLKPGKVCSWDIDIR